MSTSELPASGWTQLTLPLEADRQTRADDRLDWPHAAGVIGVASAGLWAAIWQFGQLLF